MYSPSLLLLRSKKNFGRLLWTKSMSSLDHRILSFIEGGKDNPALFDALAHELDQFQREKVALYKTSPLPTAAFKLGRISTFPPEKTIATFFTSGTTEVEKGK